MHGAKSVNRIIKRINILKVVVLFSIKSKKTDRYIELQKVLQRSRVGSIDHGRVG